MLGRMAELGMRLLSQVALAKLGEAEAPGPSQGDPCLQFCRYSKAVRQCIALQNRITEGRERGRERRAEPGAAERRAARRKADAKRLLETSIVTEGDADEREDLVREAIERLDDPEFGAAWADKPIGALVEAICNDLGIAFDCRQWTDEEIGLTEADVAEAQAAAKAEWEARKAMAPAEWLRRSPPASDPEPSDRQGGTPFGPANPAMRDPGRPGGNGAAAPAIDPYPD